MCAPRCDAQHKEEFVRLMNEPIGAAAAPPAAAGAGLGGDEEAMMPPGMNPAMLAAMIEGMTPEQRNGVGADMGLTGEQLLEFARTLQHMPPHIAAAMMGGMGGGAPAGGAPPGATVIRLSSEENAAVERVRVRCGGEVARMAGARARVCMCVWGGHCRTRAEYS